MPVTKPTPQGESVQLRGIEPRQRQFQILRHLTAQSLELSVQSLLKEGWRSDGPVTQDHQQVYMITMVKP
jgi:hypothetical protein